MNKRDIFVILCCYLNFKTCEYTMTLMYSCIPSGHLQSKDVKTFFVMLFNVYFLLPHGRVLQTLLCGLWQFVRRKIETFSLLISCGEWDVRDRTVIAFVRAVPFPPGFLFVYTHSKYWHCPPTPRLQQLLTYPRSLYFSCLIPENFKFLFI